MSTFLYAIHNIKHQQLGSLSYDALYFARPLCACLELTDTLSTKDCRKGACGCSFSRKIEGATVLNLLSILEVAENLQSTRVFTRKVYNTVEAQTKR